MGTRSILEGHRPVRGDDGKWRESTRDLRTKRRTLVQALFRDAQDPRREPAARLAVNAIATELNAIRRYPSRDGFAKDRRFRIVVNRPQFQSPI